jgi:hypothetical protein
MSLRAFHVIFIVCSILMSIGFSFWAYLNFQHYHTAGYLWTAILSLACAMGLVVYFIYFVVKIKG